MVKKEKKPLVNKKIKNATPKIYNNIEFKSTTEIMAYKTLLLAGLNPQYEQNKYIIWSGFYPTVKFYDRGKDNQLRFNNKKLINITYTPDFTFEYNNTLIIIEVKGFENDVFPVKKKLFRGFLEKNYPKALFFEIYTKRQLLEAIAIIKEL